MGIIGGAGKMGAWFSRLLTSKGYNVKIYDKDIRRAKELSRRINIENCGNTRTLIDECDFIMIAVPAKATPDVVEEVREIIVNNNINGKVIFDITTFKTNLINLYQQYPRTVKVSTVHPLFGPGARTPGKYTIAIIPIPGREEDSQYVKEFFRSLGFKIKIVNFKVHDEIVALTIGVSHIIGILLASLLSSTRIDDIEELSGTTFKYLMVHLKSITYGDKEFLKYILLNDNVKRIIDRLRGILSLMAENPMEVLKDIDHLKKHWKLSELKAAYSTMYDCLEKIILKD